MSIQYKMVRRNDYYNPEENKKEGFYPQVVRKTTLTTADIALRMAKGKAINVPDAKAMIETLIFCIKEELLDGNHVMLDGWGTFSLTAQRKRKADSPSEIRAESIEVKRVVFKPSPAVYRYMKRAQFVRAKE
ncbi:MAG: HU family DNA-binding protein [Dysgonamonadaceae bacterium]